MNLQERTTTAVSCKLGALAISMVVLVGCPRPTPIATPNKGDGVTQSSDPSSDRSKLSSPGSTLPLRQSGEHLTDQPVSDQNDSQSTLEDKGSAIVRQPSETPLSEIEGRALLARLFREAGYRILYDVMITSDSGFLTVDGFDRIERVGFEYIDRREQGVKRTRPPADEAILIVGPGRSEVIAEKARLFLEARPAKTTK